MSKSSWGAIFDEETTGGRFVLDELLLHNNVSEMKAIFLNLEVYVAI